MKKPALLFSVMIVSERVASKKPPKCVFYV